MGHAAFLPASLGVPLLPPNLAQCLLLVLASRLAFRSPSSLTLHPKPSHLGAELQLTYVDIFVCLKGTPDPQGPRQKAHGLFPMTWPPPVFSQWLQQVATWARQEPGSRPDTFLLFSPVPASVCLRLLLTCPGIHLLSPSVQRPPQWVPPAPLTALPASLNQPSHFYSGPLRSLCPLQNVLEMQIPSCPYPSSLLHTQF